MSIPPQAFQIMEESVRVLQRKVIDAAVAEFRQKLSGSFTASGQVSAAALGGTIAPATLPDLAGDATGPPGTNVVGAVQGQPFDTTPPNTGDTWVWTGSMFVPTAPAPADQIVLTLTNKSGGSVALGDVVMLKFGGSQVDAFTTNSDGVPNVTYAYVGVALETIANDAAGQICVAGRVPQINLEGAGSGFEYLALSVTPKLARLADVIRPGIFGYMLGTGATPPAIIWGWPQQGRGDQVSVPMHNSSGGDLALGDVVVGVVGGFKSFTTTTTAAYADGFVGVLIEPIADGFTGLVCISGLVDQVNLTGSGTSGDLIKTSTTAGQADPFSPIGAGAFGQLLTTGATPLALLWSPPK